MWPQITMTSLHHVYYYLFLELVSEFALLMRSFRSCHDELFLADYLDIMKVITDYGPPE